MLHIRPTTPVVEYLYITLSGLVSHKEVENETLKGAIKSTIMQGDGPQTMGTAEDRHLSFFSLSSVSASGCYFQVMLCSCFPVKAFLIFKNKLNKGGCLHEGMVVISAFIYITDPYRLNTQNGMNLMICKYGWS